MPGRIFAVRVDKRQLPGAIEAEVDLYRVALWRLLDELETEPNSLSELGILLFDSRSDLHSSVQDRRLIDAFRDWSNCPGLAFPPSTPDCNWLISVRISLTSSPTKVATPPEAASCIKHSLRWQVK